MNRRPAVAATGALLVAVGLVLLPSAAPSFAAAHQHKSARKSTAVTVTGPHMLNPRSINVKGAARNFTKPSKVTVSVTRKLTNQAVRVTWSGFTPTNLQGGTPYYQYQFTLYPVEIVECKGTHPTKVTQCWQAANYQEQFGSNSNAIYSTTSQKGTGFADFQIQNSLQNSKLGCDPTHRCSIVIVPSQGGEESNCGNHTDDSQQALGITTFGGPSEKCAWAKRVVIPLTFGAVKPCAQIRNPDLRIAGSPLMQDAMAQWDTGLCRQHDDPLAVSWNPNVGEPAAIRETVQDNLADVALTTNPAPSVVSGDRTYTYAPVAVTATALAYLFDDPNTGKPYTNVELDQRLVAKLLTTSYTDYFLECTPNTTAPCDKAVTGNPPDLFQDKEFRHLNPKVLEPVGAIAEGLAGVPIVMGGDTDLTYEVTRWIAANRTAEGFIHNKVAPGGMHVNKHYRGVKYPTETFTSRDSSFLLQAAYTPVATLNLVTSALLEGQPPGNNGFQPVTLGCPPKQQCFNPLAGEPIGQRSLFGITDEADAATFLFPSAKLENASGHFVAPTDATMAAALKSMVTAKNGITQQVDLDSKNPKAYPLTMVVYALVPTSGVSSDTAAKIAKWLDYVVGPGQTKGEEPGKLPFGYLPLPSSLRAQAEQVATEVADQSGSAQASPTPTDTPEPTPTDTAPIEPPPVPTPTVSSPFPSVSPTPTPVATPSISIVALSRPPTAGMTRYALPVVLIAAGLAALLGASIGAVAMGPDFLARIGRARLGRGGPGSGSGSSPRRRDEDGS